MGICAICVYYICQVISICVFLCISLPQTCFIISFLSTILFHYIVIIRSFESLTLIVYLSRQFFAICYTIYCTYSYIRYTIYAEQHDDLIRFFFVCTQRYTRITHPISIPYMYHKCGTIYLCTAVKHLMCEFVCACFYAFL